MSKHHDRGLRNRGLFRLLGFKPSLAETKRHRTTRLADNAKAVAHLKELVEVYSNSPLPRSRTHSVTSDPGIINHFVGVNEGANKKSMQIIRNALTRRGNSAFTVMNPVSRNEQTRKRIAAAKDLQAARTNAAANTALSKTHKTHKNKAALNKFHTVLTAKGASKSNARNVLASYMSRRK